MNKDLKFLLKRAFDAGTMYEATLSEECSFNEFIKYVENQQLSICDVVSSNVKNNNKTTKMEETKLQELLEKRFYTYLCFDLNMTSDKWYDHSENNNRHWDKVRKDAKEMAKLAVKEFVKKQ